MTITKGVTIEAPPGVLAFIHPPGSTPAVTVTAGSTDVVVLRGLTLNVGPGDGIQVTSVGMLHVANCVISGFAGNGLSFVSAGQFLGKDTIARNNGGNGIRVAPSSGTAKASVDRCRLEGNVGSGFILSQTSSGIAFGSIRNSVASANGVGLSALLAVQLNIESCLVANNGTGISSNSDFVGVSNSTVTNNGTGLSGSPLLSRTNNTLEGNTTDGSFTGTFTAK